jgi:uncharacterized membrane protein
MRDEEDKTSGDKPDKNAAHGTTDQSHRPGTVSEEPDLKVPKRIRKRLLAMMQSYSGPLPPPEILVKYDEAVKNGAERVFSEFEAIGKHSRDMEWFVAQHLAKESRQGQIFGLIIGLAGLTAACFCSVYGAEKAAMVIGGSTLIGLVAVFVIGRKTKPGQDNILRGKSKSSDGDEERK